MKTLTWLKVNVEVGIGSSGTLCTPVCMFLFPGLEYCYIIIMNSKMLPNITLKYTVCFYVLLSFLDAIFLDVKYCLYPVILNLFVKGRLLA